MGDIYSEDSGQKNQPNKNSKGTPLLDLYGVNLNKLAIEGKLDPVIGRSDEILRTIQILGRRRKNNPILVGEPGVGKTAIIEGLANKIIAGDVPLSLKDKIIYSIELSIIVAGTKYRGQFEERLQGIIDELTENPNIIIFIDEIHTLIGSGSAAGSLDASNIIKPALARGNIKCIGATTFDEYRESIETDGALDRRFQKVTVDQPTYEETLEILQNIKDKYEKFHCVTYSEEIIKLIVKLTDRYVTDRFFPDKAIDVLDEVGSYKQLISIKTPIHIKEMEISLETKELDKDAAVRNQNYEIAASTRDDIVKLKKRINIEYLKWKTEMLLNKVPILVDDVLYIMSKSTGVPVEKISDKENESLLELDSTLKGMIIGQDHAIDKIATTIKRNRVGINKGDRTIGNFIFLGPSGVGKTELAKSITECLFDSVDSLIRIDMSEYMEKHSVSKLVGAPPGYVGYGEGGFLTEQVKRNPHSVILFDEIEKAHPDVFNILLQMLDDGHLTDSNGRRVDFRNCLIIMTSNTGLRQIQEFGTGIGFKGGQTSEVVSTIENEMLSKSLMKKFPPEFLNRIDEIIIFNKLTKDNMLRILENELIYIVDSLKEIGNYKLKVSKEAKVIICNEGFDEKYGARPLKRALTKIIENPISELILRKEVKENDTISIKTKKGIIFIDVLKSK